MQGRLCLCYVHCSNLYGENMSISCFRSHKIDRNMRKSHVATKTFQALRIFVNNELNELHNGLTFLHPYMNPGGCCVALTFHSLEERIVKRHFHGIDIDQKMNLSHSGQYKNSLKIHSLETLEDVLHNKWKPLSKGVITPSTEESYRNQRSRSAKLRAAIKCWQIVAINRFVNDKISYYWLIDRCFYVIFNVIHVHWNGISTTYMRHLGYFIILVIHTDTACYGKESIYQFNHQTALINRSGFKCSAFIVHLIVTVVCNVSMMTFI